MICWRHLLLFSACALLASCLPTTVAPDHRLSLASESAQWHVSMHDLYHDVPSNQPLDMMFSIEPNFVLGAKRLDQIGYPYPIDVCVSFDPRAEALGSALKPERTMLKTQSRSIPARLVHAQSPHPANRLIKSCWLLDFDIDFTAQAKSGFSFDLQLAIETPKGQPLAVPPVHVEFLPERLGLCGFGCFGSH